jgi:hypothetical protein
VYQSTLYSQLPSFRPTGWIAALVIVLSVFQVPRPLSANNSAPGIASADAGAAPWPDPNAYWVIKVDKLAGAEMTDTRWGHLHEHSSDALSVKIGISIDHFGNEVFTDYGAAALRIRYTVRGVAVSPWLDPPYEFVLAFDNPALNLVPDGIHDLSVEIQALEGDPGPSGSKPVQPVRANFRPYPMFLHIGGRGTASTFVPVINQNEQDNLVESSNADGNYLNAAILVPRAHPASPSVTPWTGAPPYVEDLYQEPMQPHSREFTGAQMLWEEPAGTINAGLRFIRALPPKLSESYIGLWNNNNQIAPDQTGFSGHRSLPVKDGPRGIGWTNGYAQGVVDTDGVLWMVNASGQLRVMRPDGELITVVGWRVKPDKAPIWYLKSLTAIRQNMQFRGSFTSGGWTDPTDPGWHQPMDVALDPTNPNRVYVASMYDNAIYQVDVDRTTWTGTVSVLAGDPNHTEGYADGVGSAARFRHPFSLVTSLDGKVIYVSDHDNDAIRTITVATRNVKTLFGGPGVSQRLQSAGVQCATDIRLACYPASAVKPRLQVTVTAAQAAAGIRPDFYFPYFVRIASTGDLVIFDRGLNTLRRINPQTGTATVLDQLDDGGFDGNWTRGWVWGDVDRTGNSGVVDGIYWGNATSMLPLPAGETSDRFNENYRFTSLNGTIHSFVFGRSMQYDPEGFGAVSRTLPPHYPWLMAVDPRGAVIFGGIGDHGLTRLRVRTSTDPVVPDGPGHLDARRVWNLGAPSPQSYYYTFTPNSINIPTNPPALWYGWGAHNYLGLADAWDITLTTTDSQIDALFALPSSITSNAGAHAAVLAFLRANSGSGSSDSPPYIPYSTPLTTVTSTCATPDPFATMGGGTCYNGGWLPPGMAPPNTTPSTGSGGFSTAGTSTGASCTSPDPFVSMGGGTCWYGGWLPPAMTPPGGGSPSGPPSPGSGSQSPGGTSGGSTGVPCTTPNPFATMGGGTCYNGGWLPPGMAPPSGSTGSSVSSGSPSTGSQGQGCTTPDPFVSIPSLIGVCVNGGWIPQIKK